MLRRIATLTVYAAISLVAVGAVFAWYQQFQPVPYRSYYTAPCLLDATPAWCGSLNRIFSAGAMLLGAGVVLLITCLTIVALVLLRMARQRWPTLGGTALAGLAGVGALWLSRQALESYYNLSLLPDRYPAEFFPARLAAIDRISQAYMAWSVGAFALTIAMLIFSSAILWSARKLPLQTIALTPAL
jgi:hypothetical protein